MKIKLCYELQASLCLFLSGLNRIDLLDVSHNVERFVSFSGGADPQTGQVLGDL